MFTLRDWYYTCLFSDWILQCGYLSCEPCSTMAVVITPVVARYCLSSVFFTYAYLLSYPTDAKKTVAKQWSYSCLILVHCIVSVVGICRHYSESRHCYFVSRVSCVWCGRADLNWQLRIFVDVLQSFASELLLVVYWDSLSGCVQLGSRGCLHQPPIHI